jgi:hypothetical protein
MCRWNAWFGRSLVIDERPYRTPRSLIDQALRARLGVETTNGDGFGIGWYPAGDGGTRCRHGGVHPAWSDANLRDLAAHVESPLSLARIRATTGTPVRQTNCHLFYLALTFGLEGRPARGRRVRGRVRGSDRARPWDRASGTDDARLQRRRPAVGGPLLDRGASRTLYVSTDRATLQALDPDNPRFAQMSDEDRIVVSEPLSDHQGAWLEVAGPPRSSCSRAPMSANHSGRGCPRLRRTREPAAVVARRQSNRTGGDRCAA